jgi:hypothetical protein
MSSIKDLFMDLNNMHMKLAKAQARLEKLNPELQFVKDVDTDVYVDARRRKVKPASRKKKGSNNDTD